MVAKRVAEDGIENDEGFLGKVFSGWNAVENDGLVAGQGFQKIDHGRVADIGEKSVIPEIDQVLLCQCLDFGEVHDHAVCGIAVLMNDLAAERDFEYITMPVQVSALAFVIGDSVAGVEFQAAGNEHGKIRENTAYNYIIAPEAASASVFLYFFAHVSPC